MVNCQNNRGKRRRSGASENKTPEKKARYDVHQSEATASTSEPECKNGTRKKRLRKRTKGLRELIKSKIEVALRTFPSPLGHLFSSRDESGTPQAPYSEVVKAIGLSEEDWLKAISLPSRAVESISNITDMFYIERSLENRLMVKYRVAEWSIDDCTVYLDNLPEGCTAEKICRIARKFGTVVEVRLPKSHSRPTRSAYGVHEMGRRPKSFAFLQFTEPEACQRMCAAFSHNAPTERRKSSSQSLMPLLQQLLAQIRKLSRRRRRRTYAQNMLLIKLKRKQAAIIKKERTANKRTHKISRAAEQEKNFKEVEQENGRTLSDTACASGELNTSTENCEHRRNSIGKKKKSTSQRGSSRKQVSKKTRRKRRKRRRHEVGPHTICGSVNDYFEKLQVIPYARYRELREEYLTLRRDSNRSAKEVSKQHRHFVEFCSTEGCQTLDRKLGSYRERFWCTDEVEQE
ncbi:hypothetical protein Y032_0182g894 [Ancylostoma ceylanicum]|uniref:RRM domain-containing protein n=1 Tax=Ancylostoma ceylanicum TaxID=53326 RepID=A0A016SSV2_9BILA|nr:hypothetical protein Y032_0182g894 [Ancylostoma ceylanicum]